MKNENLRRFLISLSDQLEIGVKKLRGAANKMAPQNKITLADCERNNWENVEPCFVLSSGRCGTLLLNRLLLLSPDVMAVHEPKPELIRASKKAFEEIKQSPEIFKETLKSAREELILDAAQHNKIFVETNNRITFFTPIIPAVFPNAKFIHLVRHPGDFVRSGIRRKWYTGGHDHDIGRIVPLDEKIRSQWNDYSIIEKIGWLWNETNQFIEDFKLIVDKDKILFIKAENLFTDATVINTIFSFLNIEGQDLNLIKKMLSQPVNKQKKGSYPKFTEWSIEDKQKLKEIAPLASEYKYHLS